MHLNTMAESNKMIKTIDTMDIMLEDKWKIHQLQHQSIETKQLWFEIQDMIGPAKLWPHLICKLFWTKGIKHDMRPIICAFVIINGLNPEVILFLML